MLPNFGGFLERFWWIFEANLGGRLADPLEFRISKSKRGGAWPPIRNPFKFYQSGRGESFPENWNDFGGGFGANLGGICNRILVDFGSEFWWIWSEFGGNLETALKTALELRLRNRP